MDAMEANLGLIQTYKYYEVAKFVTANVNLWPFPTVLVINKDKFNALSEEQQKVIRDAAAKVPGFSIKIFTEPPSDRPRRRALRRGAEVRRRRRPTRRPALAEASRDRASRALSEDEPVTSGSSPDPGDQGEPARPAGAGAAAGGLRRASRTATVHRPPARCRARPGPGGRGIGCRRAPDEHRRHAPAAARRGSPPASRLARALARLAGWLELYSQAAVRIARVGRRGRRRAGGWRWPPTCSPATCSATRCSGRDELARFAFLWTIWMGVSLAVKRSGGRP